MSDNLLMLVMVEARGAIKPEDSLEDRCRSAMKVSAHHWMVLDQDVQFRAAIAAVYESATDDEQERIKDELDNLRALNAMMTGVPVDFDNVKPVENPIGLNKMWREVTSDV